MTTDQYIPSDQDGPIPARKLLEPGGPYPFVVLDANPPTKNKNGNWVMKNVKLGVGPEKKWVFDNPWSGVDKNGDVHDNIKKFLHAIDRLPAKGQAPNYSRLLGAKGTCHIKIEQDQNGEDRNKIRYYITPRETGSPPSSVQHAAPPPVIAGKEWLSKDPGLDVEPDDIPF